MIEFFATDVVVDDSDDSFLLVGFGSAEESLHIQRAYEFDEQDVELGMDNVYLERGSQAYAAYGGVTAVHLTRTQLQVLLNEGAAAKLAGAGFRISFNVAEIEFSRLRQSVITAFENLGVSIEIDA